MKVREAIQVLLTRAKMKRQRKTTVSWKVNQGWTVVSFKFQYAWPATFVVTAEPTNCQEEHNDLQCIGGFLYSWISLSIVQLRIYNEFLWEWHSVAGTGHTFYGLDVGRTFPVTLL